MPVELSGIASTGAPEWQRGLAGRVAPTLPVKDGDRAVERTGRVAGAVVTTEEVDVARPGQSTPSSDGMAALRRK